MKKLLTIALTLPCMALVLGQTNLGGSNSTGGGTYTNIGFEAGRVNNGWNNSFIGQQAGYNNNAGSNNSYLGYQSGLSNSSGSGNSLLGYRAFYDGVSGDNNTVLGFNTGFGITTGSNNTILGANISGLPSTMSNYIILADGAGNRRLNIDNNGNVGIGTNSPAGCALLDLTSPATPKGLLLPRLTTSLRNSVTSPAAGLQIYNTTTNTINYYDGTAWRELNYSSYTAGNGISLTSNVIASTQWTTTASELYNNSSLNKVHVGWQANSYDDNYKMSVETNNNNMGLYVFNQAPNSIGTFTQGTRVGLFGSVGTYDLNNVTNRTVWQFTNNFVGGYFMSYGDASTATTYGVVANAYDYGTTTTYGVHSTARGNSNDVVGVYGTTDNENTGYAVIGEVPSWSSSVAAYGVKGIVNGSHNSIYAIYGDIFGLSSNLGTNPYWAGYFNGDVYSTGNYLPSDRKLKKDINGMGSMLDKIMQLKPSDYSYDAEKFKGMNFASGKRYGFIADELETVFPQLTKKTIQPERKDEKGNVIGEAVEFTAVNYVELIPVLTKAMQEQQALILNLQKRLDSGESLNKIKTTVNPTSTQTVEINQAAVLFQNHPNPFNGVTFIDYFLPSNSTNAFVRVTDNNGRLVQAFPINQTGYGQVELNCQNLAAGNYFYSLIVNSVVIDSKQMVITSKN